MKKKIGKTVYHVLMIAVSFLMLYPLLWMIASSFKEESEIMVTATSLIPKNFTFDNYIKGWTGLGRYTFKDFFQNSIVIALGRTIGVTISSTLVAYGFARIKFRGRKFWFALMIGSMCLPGMVLQIPQYLLFNKLGWVGTFLPIIVPGFFGGAYNIFMLMQFMKNVPREMDEAAMIDGCGRFRFFIHIMLPLIRPAVIMVAVLVFIAAWGDFHSALIYLNKPSTYPVAFALKLFTDEYTTSYGPLLAMSTLSLLPIMVLFLFFQKSLIDGVSTSGIKG